MSIGSYLMLACVAFSVASVVGLFGAAIGYVCGHWAIGAAIGIILAAIVEFVYIRFLSKLSM